MTGTASGNLPAVFSSFTGRRRNIAEIRRRLETARLVTLTGVGGVGKTRLALEAATSMRKGFPDGVWLMDLCPRTGSVGGAGRDRYRAWRAGPRAQPRR
ncbi:hypothetical protein [Streptomyces ipomoeae]|uniref:hypothetical protein n=1 Tax=Streptomyces ipomoeae TaxID=103232 RepID=UPI0015F11911